MRSLILSLLFIGVAPVFAQEAIPTPVDHTCISVTEFNDKMKKDFKGAKQVELTGSQYHFIQGIYSLLPTTPKGLPPGNKALMVTKGDQGMIIFINGKKMCDPISAPKELQDLLRQVKDGPGDRI